jgi:hypothetical protein
MRIRKPPGTAFTSLNAHSFNASIRHSRCSRGVLSLSRDTPAPRPTPSSFSRFRVEHQIGVGALGPVFQGRDVSPDRLVAIKAFTLELTGAQAAAFADRLGSLVSLGFTHPSIVAPIAAGLEGDTPYLVEEYVFGESLDVALRRYGPAPAADAARLLTQVAAALDAASSVGVLHGALHPRDVLVTPDLVRLTGLGVIGSLERAGARPPSRPPYSAPEQSAGGSWETRADVFSLARVAVELLTGRSVAEPEGSPAFDFEGTLVARPEELRQVLLRGLAPKPRHRYATAGDLAAALELALTGRSSRPAHAERMSRAAAAARSGDAARRRRARPHQHEADVPLVIESRPAAEVPLQPALAGIDDEVVAAPALAVESSGSEDRQIESPPRPADPGTLSVDPELARLDAGQTGPGESDVPAIEITPPPPAAPEVGDTLRLATPEPEQPVMELGLTELPPIESPPGGTVPVATLDDLPLEPRPVAAELIAERSGSLPFEEREPAPQAPEPTTDGSGGGVEDEGIGESDRRSLVLPVAIALAAVLILGIYGGYRMVTRRGALPAESATASVPSATPAQVPAAPDIYLPAPPEPAATGTSGPAVRQLPITKKTTKATTAPKATASPTAAARRPAGTTAPGSLSIESRPTGARVFLDGRSSGTTPLVLPRVSAGTHDVRLERTGYRRWSSKIRVTSSRRARLTASLEPESSR